MPATCRAPTRSRRRRHSLPSGVRLMPTSMTIAPGLIMSPVTRRGLPVATTSTSARRVCPARSRVREVQMVTVALRWSSMSAIGLPTMLLRPTTTASRPSSATPDADPACAMHPAGVHGTNPGWPTTRLPTFWTWKPSTSFSTAMVSSTFVLADLRAAAAAAPGCRGSTDRRSARGCAPAPGPRGTSSRQLVERGMNAGFIAGLDLVAHVDARGRVVADQDDREPGWRPPLASAAHVAWPRHAVAPKARCRR